MKTIQKTTNFGPLFEKLLVWFDANRRSLPFRETRDAYSIWLAEIIMQQTRMDQGLPYYLRFKERYPDVQSLANAEEAEVLKLWQGLGYYSRGRNLLHTAKTVVAQYGGVFPTKNQELLKLKGIGPYTAAAIASMAGNEAVALVDGNVERILSRLFAIENPVNETKGQQQIRQTATQFLNTQDPGKHNEALMELGSLICTPRNPNCTECPFQMGCKAHQQNFQNLLPIKTPKKPVAELHFFYVYITMPLGVIMRKRTEQGIWKHLYEPPFVEVDKHINELSIQQYTELCLRKWKIPMNHFRKRGVYHQKHRLTHRLIHATLVHLETETEPCLGNSELFVATYRALKEDLALTRLQTRFQEKIEQNEGTGDV